MYRLLLTAVMIVGVLSGFVEGGTLAYLTSSTSASSRFVTGTVELTATEDVLGALDISDFVPGDSVTAALTITNTGTLSLRYGMRTPIATTATGADAAFFQVLVADIWLQAESGGNCDTVAASPLYSGPLEDAAFGLDAASDSYPNNDDNRLLPPETLNTEVLCFKVTFPDTAGTTHQKRTAFIDYRFVGFQAAGTTATGTP